MKYWSFGDSLKEVFGKVSNQNKSFTYDFVDKRDDLEGDTRTVYTVDEISVSEDSLRPNSGIKVGEEKIRQIGIGQKSKESVVDAVEGGTPHKSASFEELLNISERAEGIVIPERAERIISDRRRRKLEKRVSNLHIGEHQIEETVVFWESPRAKVIPSRESSSLIFNDSDYTSPYHPIVGKYISGLGSESGLRVGVAIEYEKIDSDNVQSLCIEGW